MGKMSLTSENVQRIFKDCLSDDSDAAEIKGVNISVTFSTEKVAAHSRRISRMLEQLPDKFHKEKGGGWSFLNLCMDKYRRQWTDLHSVCDMLVCLGIATGHLSFPMPRDLWNISPGEMPYVVVNCNSE